MHTNLYIPRFWLMLHYTLKRWTRCSFHTVHALGWNPYTWYCIVTTVFNQNLLYCIKWRVIVRMYWHCTSHIIYLHLGCIMTWYQYKSLYACMCMFHCSQLKWESAGYMGPSISSKVSTLHPPIAGSQPYCISFTTSHCASSSLSPQCFTFV